MTALTINSIVALFDEEKKRVDALEEMEYIFVLERPSTLSDKKAYSPVLLCYYSAKWHKVRETIMLEQGVLQREYNQASSQDPP